MPIVNKKSVCFTEGFILLVLLLTGWIPRSAGKALETTDNEGDTIVEEDDAEDETVTAKNEKAESEGTEKERDPQKDGEEELENEAEEDDEGTKTLLCKLS